MRIANDDLLAAPGDLSTTFESNAIYIAHASMYSIQVVFTGSPNGTFKLQVSNDIGEAQKSTEAGRGTKVVNWTDVEGSDDKINAAGDIMWAVLAAPYRWVRVVYTPTSGSGSLNTLRVNTKGV